MVEKWIHDMCHDQLIIVFFTTKMKKIQVLHKKIFLVSKDDNIKCFPQDACKYFPVQIVLFVDAWKKVIKLDILTTIARVLRGED